MGNLRSSVAPTKDVQSAAVTDAELPSNFRWQTPALSSAAALHSLPDTSLATRVLRSPQSVASALEATAIFSDYAAASTSHRLPSGANLWEVQTWTHLGIDSAKPAGVARWLEERLVSVFFFTLSDPHRFLESTKQLAALSEEHWRLIQSHP